MSWSPTQYALFEAERTRPVDDLLARVPDRAVERAVDIGCGPGNSTDRLKARFPQAVVTGIDSSAQMIAAARARLPGLAFAVADIATWDDSGPFDVILANAALQWLPDHAVVLPALVAKLAVGGSLAVQMPDNLDEPAHRLMRAVAADGPWAGKLAGAAAARASRHPAEWYYRLLSTEGCRVDIWRTLYHHPLKGGVEDLVEWFKGTGLRPFLEPLEPGEREAFLARYRTELADAYSVFEDGTLLLPFPRLFFVASR